MKRVFNPLKNLNIIRVVKVGQYDADVIIGVALQVFCGQILGILQLFNRRLNAGGNRFADRFGVVHIVRNGSNRDACVGSNILNGRHKHLFVDRSIYQ
ncbi:hypothetical protein SDC9_100093 [bioreactor metagenome]|uniref:Uncharacterized protein n=1 Tax=bioreactor metagenome TaxID=1076179 RepID=A0A645AK65_9ZZZZ